MHVPQFNAMVSFNYHSSTFVFLNSNFNFNFFNFKNYPDSHEIYFNFENSFMKLSMKLMFASIGVFLSFNNVLIRKLILMHFKNQEICNYE